MQVVELFFEKRLQVSTIARIYAPSLCIDYSPSANDVSNGISSSDLHIYVRYITDSTQAYRATGRSCKYVSSLTLPDNTLQQGRPTIGLIKFNTNKIIDGETALTNRLFASITATSMHETIHILGFDTALFNTFLDPATGAVHATTMTGPTLLDGSRNSNYILETPFVRAWTRDFFGCNTLGGMALEN